MKQGIPVFYAAVRSAGVYVINQSSSSNLPQSLCTVKWLIAADIRPSRKIHACKRWDD